MDDKLSEWLKNVVEGLVSNPEKVEISRVNDEQGVLFSVKVANADVGKVIGKKGIIANAIRTLLRSSGYLVDVRASMKVVAPGSNYEPKEENYEV